jgi:hypothetical protein
VPKIPHIILLRFKVAQFVCFLCYVSKGLRSENSVATIAIKKNLD